MTCREKLKMEHPEWVGDEFPSGCGACPSWHGYLDDPEYCGGPRELCTKCWDREIPETEPIKKKGNKRIMKPTTTTRKTKEELVTEIKGLRTELEKLEKFKKYEDCAGELRAMYESFVDAGFEDSQAFELTKICIQTAVQGR